MVDMKNNNNKLSMSDSDLPKVIFFDAMGTLFDLKSSVGEIYQQYALKYDVIADADLLDRAFHKSFKSAPTLAFSEEEIAKVKEQEYLWWKNVVAATFAEVGLLEKFSEFTEFFAKVYQYFATVDPWDVFPDTISSLERWRDRGVELGVISNFDTRLIEVLNILNLSEFFTSITISSVAGSAKPEQNIFQIALNKHHVIAPQAWHVGDNVIADYNGAKNVGINSFWLNRKAQSLNIKNQLPNLSSLG